jgi:hypothetical protein
MSSQHRSQCLPDAQGWVVAVTKPGGTWWLRIEGTVGGLCRSVLGGRGIHEKCFQRGEKLQGLTRNGLVGVIPRPANHCLAPRLLQTYPRLSERCADGLHGTVHLSLALLD